MRRMESASASNPGASTIVPMQTDYENDPQICLTCVSFLSKKLADTIRTTLIDTLIRIEPAFYYYPVGSLHVTIQNIRVIHDPPQFSASDIKKAKSVLINSVAVAGPFPMTFQGILRMPTSCSVIALIHPGYDRYIAKLRSELSMAGVPDDKKYFTDDMVFANTTFCRYTHKPSEKFLEELSKHGSDFFGTMTVREVSLITTNAGAHPSKTRIFGQYRFG